MKGKLSITKENKNVVICANDTVTSVTPPKEVLNTSNSLKTTLPAAQPDAKNGNEDTGRVDTNVTTIMTNPENSDKVKSAFLKNETGVKLNGVCGAEVGIFLVPHIYIYLQTKDTNIQLQSELIPIDKTIILDKGTLKNKCSEDKTKTFKFVAYIKDNILTLKWKVYPPKPATSEDNIVDVRKFRIPTLDVPISSIQVHTWIGSNRSYILESKNYAIKKGIPEKCETIATNCFLSGFTDIEKCYKCTLRVRGEQHSDVCYKFISKVEDTQKDADILTAGSSEDSDEYKLKESIDNILNLIYKTDVNNNKELIKLEELDNTLKMELINYCNLLKQVDMSGTLENHELANDIETYNNLTKLLIKHDNEKKTSLHDKLKNPAICMKNVHEWIKNRRGLVLPQMTYKNVADINNVHLNQNEELQDSNNTSRNIYKEGNNEIIDLTDNKNKNVDASHFTDSMFCNDEYCDRLKDKNSCVSKIEVQDQGNCSISWIFASKLHLESIKCMKGYEHGSISALYVANCANKEAMDKYHVGSNPLEFLKIIDDKKFLPLEYNLPYAYAKVGNDCPNPQKHWTNLWTGAKLVDSKNEPNSLGAKGYTAYESDKFRGNMDTFIKKIKHEVMHKGSVIAYVKVENVMGYDLNGKKVLSVCGDKNADHAVNIIGWGNYINDEGKKKSYWIVRNSWGKYWGDDGNFKVDIHGPEECEHNFIHTVAMFNIDMPVAQVVKNKDAEIFNYYGKTSPDFFSNLYYKSLESVKNSNSSGGTFLGQNSMVHGNSGSDTKAQEVSASSSSSSTTTTTGEEGTNHHQTSPVVGGAAGGTEDTTGKQTLPTEESATVEKQDGATEKEVSPPATGTVKGTTSGEPSAALSKGDTVPTVNDPSKEEVAGNGKGTQGSQANKGANSVENAASSESIEIIHILKHIKNSNVKMGLVKYDHEYEVGEHSCMRTSSTNPEKHSDCVKFCKEKFEECEKEPIPGICLANLYKSDDCFFCYV
ncbi:serine repeat antigen 4 (SERA4) [Plasmodium malariae]|uniref:Serine repeat antigen 4 (SERA4) n=1 Tax=Plasmodium malariae TaxID=5858 RepID=A0A1A8X916_PLAMA|nr:serine repeat antigen 4 (SERA4) [Plasmodium malariae]